MKAPTKLTYTTPRSSISVDGIDFHDTVFSESGLHEVVDFLNSPRSTIFQRKGLNIYYLGMSDFLAEFDSEGERDEYVGKIGASNIQSNKEKQIPKSRGYFSYDGKFYIILGTEHNFEENIEDTDFGYKGIIFDVNSFENIGSTVRDTKGTTGDIL